SPPSGLAVSSSCELTIDGSSFSAGSKYAYQVELTESGSSSSSTTIFDGMLQIVSGNLPTCSGSGNFTLSPGQAFSTNFVGSDADGGNLSATLINGPSGSYISPTSGTEPLTTTFYWTPTSADVGAYASLVTFTDSSGFEGSCSLGMSVIAYPIPDAGGPYAGNEASAIALDGSASASGDPTDSTSSITTYEWDCESDGTYDYTSTSPTGDSCTYGNDGSYTVTLRVTDGYGLQATATAAVTVNNVAPTFTTTGGTTANIAEAYSYSPAVTDPADTVFTWSLGGDYPGSMTVDSATGEISWTPTYEEWLASGGSFTFTLTVNDGTDTTTETITITVGFVDGDNDGVADVWELENGYDPTDPSDASLDNDSDGLTTLDEFLRGQDPAVFDGPTAPVLVFPSEFDFETTELSPTILWNNATDPQDEELTYEVEIFAEVSLTTLVATGSASEDPSGISSWLTNVVLSDNTGYFVRVRASDGYAWGDWSIAMEVFINSMNDAPPIPVLVYPIANEIAGSLTPTLEWVNAADIDRDAVTYDLELYEYGSEVLVWSSTGYDLADPAAINGDIVVDVVLMEDGWYEWRAQAQDEHGEFSGWSDKESFIASAEKAMPEAVFFIDPLDGAELEELQPVFEATEGSDAEGLELSYTFELDLSANFDSSSLISVERTGPVNGSIFWDLSEDPSWVLIEHSIMYSRVRGVDTQGVGSLWDTISFFVRGPNDPPEVPELIAPSSVQLIEVARPSFEFSSVLDPEGDDVTYDVLIAIDGEMTEVVAEVTGLINTDLGASLSWLVDVDLEGDYYWTARAVDEYGAASEWAEPVFVTVGNGFYSGGCACASTSTSERPAWALMPLLMMGLLIRRRQS
ncbi:MAG: putative Ig domain-containing protein, partial [Myxococcota bacterium]|nr:putative Ig domain-containing protein [Myxococcota bacterium]